MANVFPIPRPPVPPAWCGHPGHPDWCDCGCGPPCPPSTVDAWREMARFKDMLRSIIDEMGITAKPLPGVIDGSDAKPGEVGEFMRFENSGTFPATPNTQTVSAGVLSPGDWDVNAVGFFGPTGLGDGPTYPASIISYAEFRLAPVPAGFSDDMKTINAFSEPTATAFSFWAYASMPSAVVRASITVPTLLAYTVKTQQGSYGELAGSFKLVTSARRVR